MLVERMRLEPFGIFLSSYIRYYRAAEINSFTIVVKNNFRGVRVKYCLLEIAVFIKGFD